MKKVNLNKLQMSAYKLLVLFFMLSSVHIISAETIINNGEEVSGTWTKKGSPYLIKGEAIVPQGKTLKIKAGVVIKFQTGSERDYSNMSDVGFLRVNGKLIAKGNSKEMIVFTRDGNYGYWGVVYLNTAHSKSEISWCKFEYGYFVRNIISEPKYDNATAVLSFNNCGGIVSNCLIIGNGWNGINCKNGADPIFTNITIYGNNYAVECNTASSPKIKNCIIYNNDYSFYINGESTPKISYSLIQDRENQSDYVDGGSNIFYSSPQFINPDQGDFRISQSSPCAGKGEKGNNIGAY